MKGGRPPALALPLSRLRQFGTHRGRGVPRSLATSSRETDTRCTMNTPLYRPDAQPASDPETAATLPPRPASYYDDCHTLRTPLTRPERVLPPKPENATPEQLREWSDRCWLIRSMFGSGN
jgi:hypothetical protein